MSAPAGDPGAPRRAALRGAVLRLAIGVVVLDVAAIALYRILDVAGRSRTVQYAFVGAWLVTTLAIVLPGLARVKSVRRRS